MVVIVAVAAAALALAGLVLVVWYLRLAFERAVAELQRSQAAETDAAVTAALEHVDRLTRSHLDGRSDVIGAGLDAVRGEVRHELHRLGELVARLGDASAVRFGQVDAALRYHADVTGKLAASTVTW